MSRTGIEWVRNPDGSQGYTCNPVTGCLNHDNGLCLGGLFPCYAFKLAHGRLKQRYLANGLVACDYDGGEEGSDNKLKAAFANPFYPRFWEERVEQLIPYPFCNPEAKVPKARGVFVCDMGDLFGIGVPEAWTQRVMETIERCPQHRFYLLTKQPQNLIKFSPFPENCWVGVTATSRRMAFDAFWDGLIDTKATTKYLSLEPLLDWTPLSKDPSNFTMKFMDECRAAGISWLIIGACTGTMEAMSSLVGKYFNLTLMHWKGNIWTAQPRIEELREIVEAADKAGIAVFLKDNLWPLLPKERPFYTKRCADVNGKDPCYEEPCLSEHTIDQCSKAPGFWSLRQEFPKVE